MDIEYNFYGSKRKKPLETIIEQTYTDHSEGALETTEAKAKAAISYAAQLTHVLYAKGILTEQDIEYLMKPILSFDTGTLKISGE